jgi:hypothetical protein
MKTCYRIIAVCLLALASACGAGNQPNQKNTVTDTASASPTLPLGWTLTDSAKAVVLGAEKCPRNNTDSDYVIIANLAAGASVRPLDSVYGSDTVSPQFYAWSVSTLTTTNFWNTFKSNRTFAMTNLQFFGYSGEKNAHDSVCYAVYYDHKFISRGCTDGTCTGDTSLPKRIVVIYTNHIAVVDYTDWNSFMGLLTDSAVAAFVGNKPIINGRSPGNVPRPRTYIARQGRNMVIYTSNYATQNDIDTTLQRHFAIPESDIVMFDGGGSTQMICNGRPCIRSGRYVPSALEIRSAQ